MLKTQKRKSIPQSATFFEIARWLTIFCFASFYFLRSVDLDLVGTSKRNGMYVYVCIFGIAAIQESNIIEIRVDSTENGPVKLVGSRTLVSGWDESSLSSVPNDSDRRPS